MRNMNNISELVKYAFVTLLGTLWRTLMEELSFVILLRKMMISCVLWRLI